MFKLTLFIVVIHFARYQLHPEQPWSWNKRGGAGPGGGGDNRRTPADYQVVYLPALLPREAQYAEDEPGEPYVAIDYSFDALGRNFELKLLPNRQLLSPHFKVFRTDEDGERHDEVLSAVEVGCHYLHRGGGAIAAISACRGHQLHGLIFIDNSTYELQPLGSNNHTRRWGSWTDDFAEEDTGSSGSHLQGLPHVIRRAPPVPAMNDDVPPLRDVRHLQPHWNHHQRRAIEPSYTIEVALFLDEAAYKIFYPFFNYNEKELTDMLLAYINGIQALYHHPSLGARVDLSLVRLQLMRSQPPKLPTHGGERSRLLDAFCEYQSMLNPEDDAHPDHWDMGLLLSGLDLYAIEGGRRNEVTLGLAPVGGICLESYSCVIAELGTTGTSGHPYPSTGFTSVYILAHEIGHNLGMHHDSNQNSCARDGFIMSPSRGTNGEVIWSSCSAQVISELGWATCLQDSPEVGRADLAHDRHGDAPGFTWGAKRQCEVHLRDPDAAPEDSGANPEYCRQLQCRSPHRTGGPYFVGPALPGTTCGHDMWCQGGECVRADRQPDTSYPGGTAGGDPGEATAGWMPWREGACRSGCVLRSRGHRERRRACAGGDSCEGAGYDVVLCDDMKVCGKKTRVTAEELAARKCADFASKLLTLDPHGGGLQASHVPTHVTMACSIVCRRNGSIGFYAPTVELKAVGADPFFPDGTWCHHDGIQDYYCLQHHCLPENPEMTAHRRRIWNLPDNDIPGSFNARPVGHGDTAEEAVTW